MSHIITEPCLGNCSQECVEICPTECIHPTKEEWAAKGLDESDLTGKQLFINPEECIDCASCEEVCPTEAIFPEDEVPEKWKHCISKNYEYYGLTYNG